MRQQESVKKNWFQYGTTTAVSAVVVLIFLFSCTSGTKKEKSGIFVSDSTAVMTTTGVSTLISDSGRISYRIEAEEWVVFNKRIPPYWSFEKGLYLEKYDLDKKIEATVKCDTAYYYNEMQLWKLLGNITIKNPNNEKFETDTLYWDQENERIYSDAYIRIEQEDQITEGYGFSSNQDFTVWEIRNTKGIYAIDEKKDAEDTADKTEDNPNETVKQTEKKDTTKVSRKEEPKVTISSPNKQKGTKKLKIAKDNDTAL